MVLPFHDRVSELNSLEKLFITNNFEMMVLYGRRRIGKTYLIKEFLKDKKGFYFICDKAGTEKNSIRLKREYARYMEEAPIESSDIDEIFRYIADKSEKRSVIILDEFSYLVEKDPSIPSVFQRIIDETLIDSNILLILCGSSISMMEEGVLSRRSPLYGRRSAHLRIGPIPFPYLKDFLPDYSTEDLVRVHSIIGGIPYHLSLFDGSKHYEENIRKIIMSKDGKLYEETDFLLKQELREPDTYRSILSSIAGGDTRLVHIANRTMIQKNDLPKYLKRLISLGMVKKEHSVTDIKASRPHYVIEDNLINFWHTFCEPFKSHLEIEDIEAPMANLREQFNTYVGRRFEDLVRNQLVRHVLPFNPDRIGRFWNKETEIDIVALDRRKGNGTFIEVKWSKVDPVKELRKLDGKIEEFPWKLKEIGKMIIAREFTEPHENCIDLDTLMSMNRR